VPVGSQDFFSTLPELTRFADVVDAANYRQAPADWHLLLTDVRGSTRAIEEGRYKDVNALGVASIIAVRNAVGQREIPFVFGGDGATLLVPQEAMTACEVALRGVRQIARECFDLELRCGAIALGELLQHGKQFGVAKLRISPSVVLAMFTGDGFAEAERRLKAENAELSLQIPVDGPAEANLEGFECRWQPIGSQRGVIVTLLATALGDRETRAQTYRDVLRGLDALLGQDTGHPVNPARLQLALPWQDFSIEARVRSGQRQGALYDGKLGFARRRAGIGRLLMALGAKLGGFDGERYPLEVIQNCDFRKFDDTLRMVLDLSPAQVEALCALLDTARQAGHLAYGLHRSPAALMTCFVRSFNGDHVHFVDGADGGYALAARQLKAQLAGL
jgi:hypothetical protein